MSRKAKQTVFRDRLELTSKCPGDILYKFDPSEEDFVAIAEAEHGDIYAIRSLAQKLYGVYCDEGEMNNALFYYVKNGLDAGDAVCAEIAVRCIERFNEHFEYLDAALGLIGDKRAEEIADVVRLARLKRIIVNGMAIELSDSYDVDEKLIRLYLAIKEADTESAKKLAHELGVPSLVDGGEADGENIRLSEALLKFDVDEWRDFWVRAIYEHAMRYGNLIACANDIATAISARADYPRRCLHLLAVKKYLVDNGVEELREEYEKLRALCRFGGAQLDLAGDEALSEIIKEAVYTSAKEMRELKRRRALLGAEIVHERNRYALATTLSNHQKRAAKHQWESLISIKCDSDVPPIFKSVPIVECRAEIKRNGVTLDKEKKSSQVLCAGEILIGDKAYPLELDFITDISHVSATKCTHCSIKIERYKRVESHLVMQVDISIF